MLQTSSFLKPFYYQLPYCICTFILLYYSTVLWFSHDLGMQLSSTAYAAQRQFQCQCGTVFSFLPFHDQAASLLPSHLCSASCSLWLALLSTTQLASLVLRLPGLAALSTALLQFLCRMEFKWRCQQSSAAWLNISTRFMFFVTVAGESLSVSATYQRCLLCVFLAF